MKVCVVGLGWMGMPIAALFAEGGNEVTGLDINRELVDEVNSGVLKRKELGLEESIKKLKATTDAKEALSDADTIAVIVPLIVNDDKSIDYSVIKKAMESVSMRMKDGALVMVHTTMPVGATRGVLKPILDKSGKRFFLAYSPLRAAAGSALYDMREKYPRILGAIDGKSMEKARKALTTFFKNEIIEMPLEEAEAVKIFEVIYRDVNIALANELALICEEKGLDYKKIKEAANTCQYYHLHDAGIGVGGHCLPVYPYLVLNTTKADKGLIRLARQINDSMPDHVIQLLSKIKPTPKKVTVFGIAYRPETSEHRFSPAITLAEKLKERGLEVLVCDPWIDNKTLSNWGRPVSIEEGLKSDVLVFAVAHPEFKNLEDRIPGRATVIDGRGMFDEKKLKGNYVAVGKGTA